MDGKVVLSALIRVILLLWGLRLVVRGAVGLHELTGVGVSLSNEIVMHAVFIPFGMWLASLSFRRGWPWSNPDVRLLGLVVALTLWIIVGLLILLVGLRARSPHAVVSITGIVLFVCGSVAATVVANRAWKAGKQAETTTSRSHES